jgi:hypothetical protein
MQDSYDLEALLGLDGLTYEAAPGYIVEFNVKRVAATPARPHGIHYALVLRARQGGIPNVKFDNAHAVPHRGNKHKAQPVAHDHWHRTDNDPGRPYVYTTAAQLLDDFWREVKRDLDERGITHDL